MAPSNPKSDVQKPEKPVSHGFESTTLSGSGALYWSRRGVVACGEHAPHRESEQWRLEGWQQLPAVKCRGGKYQCGMCHGTPIHHHRCSDDARRP